MRLPLSEERPLLSTAAYVQWCDAPCSWCRWLVGRRLVGHAMCCGRMAGQNKFPLAARVGLSQWNIVFDGVGGRVEAEGVKTLSRTIYDSRPEWNLIALDDLWWRLLSSRYTSSRVAVTTLLLITCDQIFNHTWSLVFITFSLKVMNNENHYWGPQPTLQFLLFWFFFIF